MSSSSIDICPPHKRNTLFVLGAYRLSLMALREARHGFAQYPGYTATIAESVRASYPPVLPHDSLFETSYSSSDLDYQMVALNNEIRRFRENQTDIPNRLLLVGLPAEVLNFLWLKCHKLENLWIVRPTRTSVDNEGERIFDKTLARWQAECPGAKDLRNSTEVVEPSFDEVEKFVQEADGVLSGSWAHNQDYVFLPEWAGVLFNAALSNSKPIFVTCGTRQYDPSSHAGFPGQVVPKGSIVRIVS